MPALTSLSTAGVPVTPVNGVVGPVAVRVQSVMAAVPPLSLVMVLTSLRWAVWSSLVIEQMTSWPAATMTWLVDDTVTAAPVPSLQVHAEVVYPGVLAGDSDRV